MSLVIHRNYVVSPPLLKILHTLQEIEKPIFLLAVFTASKGAVQAARREKTQLVLAGPEPCMLPYRLHGKDVPTGAIMAVQF